jgi:hypothetical protein
MATCLVASSTAPWTEPVEFHEAFLKSFKNSLIRTGLPAAWTWLGLVSWETVGYESPWTNPRRKRGIDQTESPPVHVASGSRADLQVLEVLDEMTRSSA